MIGTGTIANVLAILAGGFIGILTRGCLKEHYQEGILKAMGLAVLFIGASGALAGMLVWEDGTLSSASVGDTWPWCWPWPWGRLPGSSLIWTGVWSSWAPG